MGARSPGDGSKARTYCFYGKAGSGKTTLFGSFPGKKLLINIRDDGDDSVSDVKDLRVKDITCWQDFEDTYWWLKQNPGKFQSVAIDTMTQLQQMVIEEIMDGKKVSSKFKNKMIGDFGTMTKGDWGDVSSRLKTWITNYRDLGVEIVFIAQDRTFNLDDDDESDLTPEVGPALSPASMKHLCAAVSVVGCTFIRTRVIKKKVNGKRIEKEVKEYCIRLGPSSSYITKIRKPKKIEIPSFLTDPTHEDILELIKGT